MNNLLIIDLLLHELISCCKILIKQLETTTRKKDVIEIVKDKKNKLRGYKIL